MRNLRVGLAMFAALLSVPAFAQVTVNIQVPGLVQLAPPPPRVERVPPPRRDQVWIPGHWQWNERDYVWRAPDSGSALGRITLTRPVAGSPPMADGAGSKAIGGARFASAHRSEKTAIAMTAPTMGAEAGRRSKRTSTSARARARVTSARPGRPRRVAAELALSDG